jgi:polar amino acid transport system substrate-binding protein
LNPIMSPQLPSLDLAAAFAPSGVLRATINLGNPILAHENPATGQVGGVSVDLAQSLAAQLGVPLSPVVFKTASHAVDAVTAGHADVGFFAVDPLRGAGVHFTAPYVLIEGCHLVREHAAFRVNADVDQPGVQVAVVGGSAYDLFLTRELKAAALVRFPDAEAGLEAFLKEGLEVMAGIRQPLASIAAAHPGHRLLPDRFMVIRQAMGLSRSRPEAARLALSAFVEQAKASGFVADALARHGVQGASVAPAGEV